jgi:hypothetical protein
MRVEDYQNQEGNEFFVLEIHKLPTKDETCEEMVQLMAGRQREYFDAYHAALQRSKTVVKEAEKNGERVVCMIYKQKLVATVVNSDKPQLRIIR